MTISVKRTALASLAALTLSAAALATPAAAAGNWRDHYGHWRETHWRGGWGCEGAGCYRYGYGPFYRGYGNNSNNWCYSGESMYDGC